MSNLNKSLSEPLGGVSACRIGMTENSIVDDARHQRRADIEQHKLRRHHQIMCVRPTARTVSSLSTSFRASTSP